MSIKVFYLPLSFAAGSRVGLAGLFFDLQSGLLSRLSWLMDEATYSIVGDLPREVIYADYRDVGGLKTPFHHTVRYGGEVLEDLHVTDITTNTQPADFGL
jgi:hypothetical protein